MRVVFENKIARTFAAICCGYIAYQDSKEQKENIYKMVLPPKFHMPKAIVWSGLGFIIPPEITCGLLGIIGTITLLQNGGDTYRDWLNNEIQKEKLKNITPKGFEIEN